MHFFCKCRWKGLVVTPSVYLHTCVLLLVCVVSSVYMCWPTILWNLFIIVTYLILFLNEWFSLCFFIGQEEQYIILIFETGLDPHANSIFEKIITDIGIRNNISDFFVKISFEEANGRLVAFTKCLEDNSKGSPSHRENKIKNVIMFLV